MTNDWRIKQCCKDCGKWEALFKGWVEWRGDSFDDAWDFLYAHEADFRAKMDKS